MPQVDSVHILQKNLVLVIILCDFQSKILFLNFSLDFFNLIFSLGSPFGKDGIFQQLLGNGTCTLGFVTTGFQELPACTNHCLEVDAAVLVKTFVLDGDKGFSQIIGQFIHGLHTKTVGVGTDILVNLVAFTVIDYGGLTGGYHIV